MTPTDVRAAVLACIQRLAPEADLAALKGSEPLRRQLDIDSMDHLNLVIDLHRVLGVEIPEADYHEIATLDDMVRYLETRLGSGARVPGT